MNGTITPIYDGVMNRLEELASENQIACDRFDGCLLDNYIFYDAESIEIGGMSAKYIIVKEQYVNEWTSENVAILTNSYEEVLEYKDIFEKEI